MTILRRYLTTYSSCYLPTDHDITYYNLPREFAHDFSLKTFLSSAVGMKYKLLEIISIKVIYTTLNAIHILICTVPVVACQVSHDPVVM